MNRGMMNTNWIKAGLIAFFVAVPILIGWAYQILTAYPDEITIATGPPAGRYHPLGQRLAKEIERRLDVKVNLLETDGSLENLSLLEAGQVDFGLYQTWTVEIVGEFEPHLLDEAGFSPDRRNSAGVEFVANLYSQPAHFIVHRDAGIRNPADLEGKIVNLGLKQGGDYATSLLLLDHFDLDRNAMNTRNLSHMETKQGFVDGTLDAAFISIGTQAPIFTDLFSTGITEILSIPYSAALASKHGPMYEYKIPAGLYQFRPPAAPETDIQTVAFGTQLLTRSEVPAGIVERVTELILSEDFLKSARLGELFGDRGFAQANPEFPIHAGAQRVYYPELRPILNVEFVEATEGMRSFVFSILVAAFFGIRWIIQRGKRQKVHRLDRFTRRLLAIERRQVSLGARPTTEEVVILQDLLDEVTSLRLEGLRRWSAHELGEDLAAQCFIDMCHALTTKINAKISRERLELRLCELIDTMKPATSAKSV